MKKNTLVPDKKSVIRPMVSPIKVSNKNSQDELTTNEQLLRTTLDSSFDYLQVFKAVRDGHGKIIDFI